MMDNLFLHYSFSLSICYLVLGDLGFFLCNSKGQEQ